MKYIIIFLLLTFSISAQVTNKTNTYELIKIKALNAPFPHKERKSGHTYKDVLYPPDIHYADNTVAIVLPEAFNKNKVNIVLYLHGWYSNIDSSMHKFNLLNQFLESGVDAVFIFPEGPKNAPDSFGGKLEDDYGFKNLVDEVIDSLYNLSKINSKSIGNIILAGHSGAFRAIAHILTFGGYTENIKEVFLFDALYSELEKYTFWLSNYNGRLYNIYTDDGGTKNVSLNFIRTLKAWGFEVSEIAEDTETYSKLNNLSRIVFIHSALDHNSVVFRYNQLKKLLKNSEL